MSKTKHLKQIDAFNDDSRFKFILAGRRGGKTYLVTEDVIKTLYNAPPRAEILIVGPSNQQSKELFWEQIESRLYRLGWQYDAKISRQCFYLAKKQKIYILGAEKISRVRGHAFYKAYLDEIAFFTKPLREIWQAIRPTLSDHQGGAIVSTTPNGKGTDAYDFYLSIMDSPGWSYHYWKTLDNPYISPLEIEEAKKELDEKSFKQEYEATWQSFEGLAYYNFDETIHIKPQTINYNKPIHLVFDFNVNPTTLMLSQSDGRKLSYKKEYSFKNSSTEETMKAFCEDFKEQPNRPMLKVRGDAAGKARSSTTGKSDYFYIEEMLSYYNFDYQMEVRASNPPVIDRVKIVNSWLKPFVGLPRIEIDPSCKELVRDLSSQVLKGRAPSDDNNLGHKADAFGYDIYYENAISKRKQQGTVIL